ncbi:MAG: SHOCT domain-containing protein [Candidatus Limnocylindria bacterium]
MPLYFPGGRLPSARFGSKGVTTTAGVDTFETLRKLGELHATGVLTDHEFSAKKKELLARI